MAILLPGTAWAMWQVETIEFQHRVDQLRSHCCGQQFRRNNNIRVIAALISAIFIFTLCVIYLHPLVALPSAWVVMFVSSTFEKISFPCDPYREVTPDLNKYLPGFTYDFARFAHEKGLLSPETVLEAHQLCKRHKALLRNRPT